MRGKAHSDETRAAVMAALIAGQSVSEIAREYQLTESTVKNWKRSLGDEKLISVNPQKRADFGDLLADYLEKTLVSLGNQAEVFGDKEWIKKQPAADLAILHGVAADKAIRLLEAAERAADAGEEAA